MGVAEGLRATGPLERGRVRDVNALTADGKISAVARQQQSPFAPASLPQSTQIVREPSLDGGFEKGSYVAMAERLGAGLPEAQKGKLTAQALDQFARTGRAPEGFSAKQLHALRVTLFAAEGSRSPAAGVWGHMSLDLMRAGMSPAVLLGTEGVAGLHPLSPVGVSGDRLALEERMERVKRGEAVGDPNAAEDRQMNREIAMIDAWLHTLRDLKLDESSNATRVQQIKREIERRIAAAAAR